MLINPYSPTSATADGFQTDFSFTFPYLAPADVKAYLNGVETTAFTFLSSNVLRFNSTPMPGTAILITRETPVDALSAEIQPGGPLPVDGLNNNFRQNLYYSQETKQEVDSQDTAGLQAQITAANNTANTALTVANTNTTFVQSGTGAAARTLTSKLRDAVNVQDFGAVGNGVADDTAAINAAINEMYARGGGVVQLMAKHRVTGTIVPRSNVYIEGPCLITVASTTCWRQTPGSQLYNAGATDITFAPATGFASVEVVRLTCPQLCTYKLRFENFNNPANICFNLALVLVTTFEPGMRFPFESASSAILNDFHITGSVVGTLVRGKGVYGTIPTTSPAGSAPAPAAVISANVWHIDGYYVLTKGVECIGAWDSDKFDYVFVNLAAVGAIGMDLACDSAYPGNNYVNSHHFFLLLSPQAGVTGVGLRMYWTFGNSGSIEHDIGPAGGISIISDINSQGHNITTKATGVIDGTSNLLIETHQKNFFMGMGDGDSTRPSYSFVRDRDTGFFWGGNNQIGVSAGGTIVALFNNNVSQVLLANAGNAIAQDILATASNTAQIRFMNQGQSVQRGRLASFDVGGNPVLEVGSGTATNGTVRVQGDFIQLHTATDTGVVGAANDAAAAALGVPLGGLYRTGTALQIRVA